MHGTFPTDILARVDEVVHQWRVVADAVRRVLFRLSRFPASAA
jgi:hypothetical protein